MDWTSHQAWQLDTTVWNIFTLLILIHSLVISCKYYNGNFLFLNSNVKIKCHTICVLYLFFFYMSNSQCLRLQCLFLWFIFRDNQLNAKFGVTSGSRGGRTRRPPPLTAADLCFFIPKRLIFLKIFLARFARD